MKTLKWIGYCAAAAVAVAVMYNFGDIRRYVKIEMM